MLNRISKFILFYFAYLPLFSILVINNVTNWDFKIQKFGLILCIKNYMVVLFLLFVLIFFGIFFVKLLLKHIKTVVASEENIIVTENKNSEYLNFLITYITPFLIDFSGLNHIISFIILFTIIAYLYVDSSLFCVNPLLKIMFRYNVYEVFINNNRYFLLSKIKHQTQDSITIKLLRLDDNILIEDIENGENYISDNTQ